MGETPNTDADWSPRIEGHLPALDGLRGIAILLVLLYHSTTAGQVSSAVVRALQIPFRNFGWCGVDLFFVLSGFLITGLLYEAKPLAHYFRNFYARRVLRIFPLYYGYLALVFLLLPLLVPSASRITALGEHQAWYWLYLQNYLVAGEGQWQHTQLLDHLWSLAIEEQFYMLWPIIVLLFQRRQMMLICLAATILSLALRCVLWGAYDVNSIALYVMTPTRLDGLALGAWVALAARGPRGPMALLPMARRVVIVASGSLAAIFLWQRTFSYHNPVVFTAGFTLLALAFAALLAMTLCAAPGSLLSRAMCNGSLRMLGKYSYALYVFHQPVIMAVDGVAFRLLPEADELTMQLVRYAVSMPLCLGVALLSWHLYEKHFLRLKRFFQSRNP